jgi:hypothetical protein
MNYNIELIGFYFHVALDTFGLLLSLLIRVVTNLLKIHEKFPS